MGKNIVFRGEGYARTRAERKDGETTIKQAIEELFAALALSKEQEKRLRKDFSASIKTAIVNIRDGEKRTLTPEEKTDILNRALYSLSRQITREERTRELSKSKLLPELLQREHLGVLYKQATEWVMSPERDLDGSQKEKRLVVVQIDLDDIKSVNDEYGHGEGDKVLRAFGLCVHDNIRPEDEVFHISGDEFAALMKFTFSADTEKDDIHKQIKDTLTRVTTAAEKKVCRPEGDAQHASVGYVTLHSESVTFDRELVFEVADEAVYVSKILGVASMLSPEMDTTAGADRIVAASDMDQLIEAYPKSKQVLLKALRRAKRSVHEMAQVSKKSPEEIMQAHYQLYRGILDV